MPKSPGSRAPKSPDLIPKAVPQQDVALVVDLENIDETLKQAGALLGELRSERKARGEKSPTPRERKLFKLVEAVEGYNNLSTDTGITDIEEAKTKFAEAISKVESATNAFTAASNAQPVFGEQQKERLNKGEMPKNPGGLPKPGTPSKKTGEGAPSRKSQKKGDRPFDLENNKQMEGVLRSLEDTLDKDEAQQKKAGANAHSPTGEAAFALREKIIRYDALRDSDKAEDIEERTRLVGEIEDARGAYQTIAGEIRPAAPERASRRRQTDREEEAVTTPKKSAGAEKPASRTRVPAEKKMEGGGNRSNTRRDTNDFRAKGDANQVGNVTVSGSARVKIDQRRYNFKDDSLSDRNRQKLESQLTEEIERPSVRREASALSTPAAPTTPPTPEASVSPSTPAVPAATERLKHPYETSVNPTFSPNWKTSVEMDERDVATLIYPKGIDPTYPTGKSPEYKKGEKYLKEALSTPELAALVEKVAELEVQKDKHSGGWRWLAKGVGIGRKESKRINDEYAKASDALASKIQEHTFVALDGAVKGAAKRYAGLSDVGKSVHEGAGKNPLLKGMKREGARLATFEGAAMQKYRGMIFHGAVRSQMELKLQKKKEILAKEIAASPAWKKAMGNKLNKWGEKWKDLNPAYKVAIITGVATAGGLATGGLSLAAGGAVTYVGWKAAQVGTSIWAAPLAGSGAGKVADWVIKGRRGKREAAMRAESLRDSEKFKKVGGSMDKASALVFEAGMKNALANARKNEEIRKKEDRAKLAAQAGAMAVVGGATYGGFEYMRLNSEMVLLGKNLPPVAPSPLGEGDAPPPPPDISPLGEGDPRAGLPLAAEPDPNAPYATSPDYPMFGPESGSSPPFRNPNAPFPAEESTTPGAPATPTETPRIPDEPSTRTPAEPAAPTNPSSTTPEFPPGQGEAAPPARLSPANPGSAPQPSTPSAPSPADTAPGNPGGPVTLDKPQFSETVTVQKGDNVWKLYEQELRKDPRFAELNRAQQDFVLDSHAKALQAKLSAMPASERALVGIPSGNVDVIQSGAKIKLLTLDDYAAYDKAMNGAHELTPAQETNILRNRGFTPAQIETELSKPRVAADATPAAATTTTPASAPSAPTPSTPAAFTSEFVPVPKNSDAWTLIEKKFENNPEFAELNRAQKDFFIDTQVKALQTHVNTLSPLDKSAAGFPTGNVAQIQVGKPIDLGITNDPNTYVKALGGAQALTPEQQTNILKYRGWTNEQIQAELAKSQSPVAPAPEPIVVQAPATPRAVPPTPTGEPPAPRLVPVEQSTPSAPSAPEESSTPETPIEPETPREPSAPAEPERPGEEPVPTTPEPAAPEPEQPEPSTPEEEVQTMPEPSQAEEEVSTTPEPTEPTVPEEEVQTSPEAPESSTPEPEALVERDDSEPNPATPETPTTPEEERNEPTEERTETNEEEERAANEAASQANEAEMRRIETDARHDYYENIHSFFGQPNRFWSVFSSPDDGSAAFGKIEWRGAEDFIEASKNDPSGMAESIGMQESRLKEFIDYIEQMSSVYNLDKDSKTVAQLLSDISRANVESVRNP